MRLTSRFRGRVRTLVLAVCCIGVGGVAGPGVAGAAEKVVQNVLVTNTADNPVPVAPQGTTQIAGTVTVANQPAPRPEPVVLQKRLKESVLVSREAPIAGGVAYEVPAGKVLTVEQAQLYLFRFGGAQLREASISVGCTTPPDGGDIERVVVRLAQQDSGDSYLVTGGPVTLRVPGGSCLSYRMGVIPESINESIHININGSFTGYLTDAS